MGIANSGYEGPHDIPASRARSGDSGATDRLDGWKSIAGYFGRDRTTVIRWARDRGLPVRRLPGGRTGTVYALREELDRWAGVVDRSADDEPETAPEPSSEPPVVAAKRFTRGRMLLVVGTAAALIGAIPLMSPSLPGGSASSHGEEPVETIDPATNRKFLDARDLVAERTSTSIGRGIEMLETVTREAPNFADGHAALAEALVLSREFGDRSDDDAFRRARSAARTAIRLAPEQALGHRLMGFIAYWADHDFAEADARFRRALTLAPEDMLVHFWYGNILSHHGRHDAGLERLSRARSMSPGSVAIQTDHAWALWVAGRDREGLAALADIATRHPNFAIIHDCFATIALFEGRHRDFAHHFIRFAKLRGEADLLERSSSLQAAQARGDAALAAEIKRQAWLELNQPRVFDRTLAALVLSRSGARSELLSWVQTAQGKQLRWGSAGMVARVEHAWRADNQLRAVIESSVRKDAPTRSAGSAGS